MESPQSPLAFDARLIFPSEPEYEAILEWPFSKAVFYERQVEQLLGTDIPRRVLLESAFVWAYRDRDRNTVGFGTLSVSKDYERLTGGRSHCYIPLLAVNPVFQRRGHGRRIVEHLTAEAVSVARSLKDCSDVIFLDVYVANTSAISLYEKCGFAVLNPDAPIPDPGENNKLYFVIGMKLSLDPA
jgi:ribosomal protein S18 acetylase RimI-like enzyme